MKLVVQTGHENLIKNGLFTAKLGKRTYTHTLLFKNRTKSNKMLVTYIKNKKIYRKMKNKEKIKNQNKNNVL